MASTRQSYLAVKRQASDAVAVQPSHFLHFKEGDMVYDQAVVPNNPIRNLRWNAITAVPGKTNFEGSMTVDVDYKECVHWLSLALGGLASADISSLTDGSVYRHTMTTTNALPTITLEQGKGNIDDATNNLQNYSIERAFGVYLGTLNINGSDDVITMELTLMAKGMLLFRKLIADVVAGAGVDIPLDSVDGLTTDDTVNIYDATPQNETDAVASIDTAAKTIEIATLDNSYTVANNAKVELTPLTPDYGTPKVAGFKNASFKFGADLTAAASASDESVEEWSFEYDNGMEKRDTTGLDVIAPKGASAKLTYKKYFENVADRDRYVSQQRQAVVIELTNDEVVSATDTNNATYKLTINISDARFTSYNMPTGTDELYVVEMVGECFYDDTDASAVELVVENATIGTEYTA